MTSWTKRIGNVSHTVVSLLKQSVKPDSIEVNLSTEEFPNKEKDLPEDLVVLQENGLIQINWVVKNTKVFKKFIPVLQKYYGEDYYLLTVDDDWIYKENYVKTMITNLGDKTYYCLIHNNIHGFCTIYRSSIFKENFWTSITNKMLEYGISDYYMMLYISKNRGSVSNIKHYGLLDFLEPFNPVFPNSGNNSGIKGQYDVNRVRAAYIEINKVIKNME